jgi:hypothetical protein
MAIRFLKPSSDETQNPSKGFVSSQANGSKVHFMEGCGKKAARTRAGGIGR